MPTISQRVAQLREMVTADPSLASDREFAGQLAALDALLEGNPLQAFEPHQAQRAFFEADTRIIAAFAGNRFGKTTALTCRALIECVDEDALPPWLLPYKRWNKTTAPRGTFGRIVNPSFKLLDSVLLDSFRRWAPTGQLIGGSFDKAYKGAPSYTLSFKNGSYIEFMTYEQDLAKFGGAARHFIGYDEPPPAGIRRECRMRTVDYGGYEMFACTPLEVNTAWMRRDIYKKREHPDITVIRGSIHDNPTLDEPQRDATLSDYPDAERAAREFGDFVDYGGLIYNDFERIVVDAPPGDVVRALDPVVGIDPGIRNAGFTFAGFDDDNTLGFFDDLLVQDGTPEDYVREINKKLAKWGIDRDTVTYVIDPAARARSQVNAETVEGALNRLGVYCVHGQNNVEAGVQQIRSRIQHRRMWVSRDCRYLREEADEYAAEDREDVFKPIKQNDHVIDSARYVAMYRPFDAVAEAKAPKQQLGWVPGRALPASELRLPAASAPLGSMS